MGEQPPPDPYSQTVFVQGEGPGFERAVFFTDAVYAIAMTLIVVALEAPTLPSADEDSPRALLDALGDMSTSILMFFVTFVVIGQYWIANHRFTGGLRAIDSHLILLNLAYLSLVAFLPFPSSVLGDYSGNPVAVVLFAGTMATISALDVLQLRHARSAGLMINPPDDEGFRWMSLASLNPVFWFAVSIVLAFVLDAEWAMLSWLLAIPTARLVERRRPESLRT